MWSSFSRKVFEWDKTVLATVTISTTFGRSFKFASLSANLHTCCQIVPQQLLNHFDSIRELFYINSSLKNWRYRSTSRDSTKWLTLWNRWKWKFQDQNLKNSMTCRSLSSTFLASVAKSQPHLFMEFLHHKSYVIPKLSETTQTAYMMLKHWKDTNIIVTEAIKRWLQLRGKLFRWVIKYIYSRCLKRIIAKRWQVYSNFTRRCQDSSRQSITENCIRLFGRNFVLWKYTWNGSIFIRNRYSGFIKKFAKKREILPFSDVVMITIFFHVAVRFWICLCMLICADMQNATRIRQDWQRQNFSQSTFTQTTGFLFMKYGDTMKNSNGISVPYKTDKLKIRNYYNRTFGPQPSTSFNLRWYSCCDDDKILVVDQKYKCLILFIRS